LRSLEIANLRDFVRASHGLLHPVQQGWPVLAEGYRADQEARKECFHTRRTAHRNGVPGALLPRSSMAPSAVRVARKRRASSSGSQSRMCHSPALDGAYQPS
jgi:hypothetical protein